jgi:arginyl-tRNA synthetase
MQIENIISDAVVNAIKSIYSQDISLKQVQIQNTRKDFEGDVTVVVFPFLRISKKSPEITAGELGTYLQENVKEIIGFNVVKGFLNLVISDTFWVSKLVEFSQKKNIFESKANKDRKNVMIEYSSPNTNKPLHLGHIRNNLLGNSIARILMANGDEVVQVNLVNDRGIHICKSMLAWQKWGAEITPEKAEKKGDKLVGDFYVKFDQEYKKEIKQLIDNGIEEEKAKKEAPLILEAQEMLRKWEEGDKEVRELWEMMNTWVYKGFDKTYETLGISFDKIYHESETYKLGKALVEEGLGKGILFKKEDNSVWANLADQKLDEKLLLRPDGTSVYMTQDLGTAHQRFTEYDLDKSLYVVGNEQNYHFQVLKIVLKKLGFDWSDKMEHVSYGMVELPSGKMKSREGTVVDADDLVEEMITTAKQKSEELGKLDGLSDSEIQNIHRIIALGALKYFILRVDPKKNMMFNPEESIDFAGNTGPFIQYTYTRINSILRKAKEKQIEFESFDNSLEINPKEKYLSQLVVSFPEIIREAANDLSPALVANYIYDLAREFNQFYHDFSILGEENENILKFRLVLTKTIGTIISQGLLLLGIESPERM